MLNAAVLLFVQSDILIICFPHTWTAILLVWVAAQ